MRYSRGIKVTRSIFMQWRPVLRSWQNLASMRLYRIPKSERRTNDIKARHCGAVSSSSSSIASSQVYNALRSFHGSAGRGRRLCSGGKSPSGPFLHSQTGPSLHSCLCTVIPRDGRHLNLRAGGPQEGVGRRASYDEALALALASLPPLSPLCACL